MKKQFKSVAVVGAYTGYLLEKGGFGDIHEVFYLFYPGITLGIAAMADDIKLSLLNQVPQLQRFTADDCAKDHSAVAQMARKLLGEYVTLDSSGAAKHFNPITTEFEFLESRGASNKVMLVLTDEHPTAS